MSAADSRRDLAGQQPSASARSGAIASGLTTRMPFSSKICATPASRLPSRPRISLQDARDELHRAEIRPERSKSGRREIEPMSTASRQPASSVSRNRRPISPQRTTCTGAGANALRLGFAGDGEDDRRPALAQRRGGDERRQLPAARQDGDRPLRAARAHAAPFRARRSAPAACRSPGRRLRG